MGIAKIVLALFFLVNALFWGLWPHSTHCAVAAALGMTKCVPHLVHVVLGIAFFVVAVLIVQWNALFMK